MLTCLSLGHTHWMFGYGSLTGGSSISMNKSQLRIDEVQLHHNGRYYCYGDLEEETHFIAASDLFVYGNIILIILRVIIDILMRAQT